MSADIVERLKAARHYECDDHWYSCPLSEGGCADDFQVGCNCDAPQQHEAADEIVRLRVENERLRAATPHPVRSYSEVVDMLRDMEQAGVSVIVNDSEWVVCRRRDCSVPRGTLAEVLREVQP